MKEKTLLLKFCLVLMFVGLLGASVAFGQATLKHSYTFEAGTYDETTVQDQVGSVNGTLGGTKISIADGKATVSGATTNSDGWISLDGAALALNTYSAITLEAFVETGASLNAGYTMLAYFGTATPGNGCFWVQPTRAGNETRIEANNRSTTVTALLGGYEVDDGKMHHIVAVLNAEALTYYLDGMVIARTATGADYVSTLGTEVANLFRGVDGWNDPNYNASLLEFNIYDGTLDQNTIAKAAGKFLGLDLTNPMLQNLTNSVGTMEPVFHSESDIYEVTVPYGTTTMTINATPVVGGVTITMYDGLGNELTGGVVTFDKDDGIDIEIEVTALDGVAKKSYYVSVFPEDGKSSATLANINLSAGKLIENFMMDSTSYTALVPDGTNSVNVTGTPNWAGATVTGGGNVALIGGMGTTIITVTSEDASATKEYTVNIYTSIVTTGTDFYLVHEVNGFVAAESGAAFNQVILADAVYEDNSQIWQFEDGGVSGQYYIRNKDGNYMCLSRTSANAWDLEVYPELPTVSLDSARFILNEFEPGRFRIISVRKQQASATNNMLGPNNANLGSPLFNDKLANNPLTVFNIKLPEDVASPYDIKLAGLTVSGASLKPVFNSAYKQYYATIPAGMTSVEVTATPQDATATVTGAGTVDVSAGKGTITVTVTASADPAYKRDYVIHYLSDTQLTLKHSYTFDDGTANDQVGDADGTVKGGTFTDGTFISAKEGDYIVLPADKIALNTYPSFTMEAHVTTGVNPGWTMYVYFGNSSGGDHTYFISLAGNNNQARGVLNLGDGEVQAGSTEPGSGEIHHYVNVITNDTLYWYVDGVLAQKTANKASYLIKDIRNANAWLGFGAYNDPTWLGATNEFNIYSGQMDAATVAARAKHFLGDISTDATLSSLTVGAGELIPAFDPAVTSYSVIIPAGTTTINVSAVANDVKSTVEGIGAVDVSSGSGNAAVLVTAENGSKKTYNIAFSTPSEFTLMHSYTFEDGTANDKVGSANGTLMGAGTIANGAYTAAADGDYITLPAADIAINTYAAITLEGYIFSDVDNTAAVMLAYFGGNENGLGGNGYFITPDRWTESRTAISIGNITAPWSAEQGVTGPPVSVGEKHHIVSVLTDSSIKWYIDGLLVGEAEVSGANSIAGISTVNAWLCKGGYDADPTWMGTIDEFNIYNGVLDAATIAEHAQQYLEGESLTLMHSYTFEDGTANDVVGDLDGTIVGNVTIADGKATVDPAANGQGQNYGYISLNGTELALNAYSAITTEAFIVAGEGTNDSYTMMYYFGDNTANYLFSQMTQGSTDANVKTTTPGGEKAVLNGSVIDDGLKHHIVAVVSSTSLSFYVDGVLKGTATGEGLIAPIGTLFANLFRGPDGWNDDNWIGSFSEFNIYQGEMNASTIAQRAADYLSESDARLGTLTADVGSVVPNVSSGSTHFAVLVPEGTTSVTLTATPYVSTASVTGDGVIDLTGGETTVTIEVTSADGTVTKQFTADIVIEDPTCADNLNPDNLIADPEMTDMSKWQGWGSKTIVYGFDAYCGGSSMKLGTGGTGCDAAVDIAPFDFQPNTTYRVRAMVKTVDGSIGFLAKGSDPDFGYAINTNGEWVQMDTTFTTGANPTDNFISFNKCDYGSNCTYFFIDNYEVFVDDGTSAVVIGNAAIKVYPTYSSGDFTVKTSGNRGMISVYNLVGKLVLQRMIESSEQKVTLQNEGMYLMRVESEGATKTFKVFKTK